MNKINDKSNIEAIIKSDVVDDILYGDLPVVQPTEAIASDFSVMCQNAGENKQIKSPELSKIINASLQINPSEIQKIYQDGSYTKAFFTDANFTIDLNKDKVYGEILLSTASQTDAKISNYDRLNAPNTIYTQMKRNLVDRQSIESDVIFSIDNLGYFVCRFNGEPYTLVAEDIYPIVKYALSDVDVTLVNGDSQLQLSLKSDNVNTYIDARNKATINNLLTQAMVDCLKTGDIKVTKISDTTFSLNFNTPIDANFLNNLINQNKWLTTSVVNNKLDFNLTKTLGLADSYTDSAINTLYNDLFRNNPTDNPEFVDIALSLFKSQFSTISFNRLTNPDNTKGINFEISSNFNTYLDNTFIKQQDLVSNLSEVITSNDFAIATTQDYLNIGYDYNKFKTIANNALNDLIQPNGDVRVRKTGDQTSILALTNGLPLNPTNLQNSINPTPQYSTSIVNNKVQLDINIPQPTPVTADTIIGLSNNSDPLSDVTIEKSANANLYRARIPDAVLTKRIQPMIDASNDYGVINQNLILNDYSTQNSNQQWTLSCPTGSYRNVFNCKIISQTAGNLIANRYIPIINKPSGTAPWLLSIYIDGTKMAKPGPNVPMWIKINLNISSLLCWVILQNDNINWDGIVPVNLKFWDMSLKINYRTPFSTTLIEHYYSLANLIPDAVTNPGANLKQFSVTLDLLPTPDIFIQ